MWARYEAEETCGAYASRFRKDAHVASPQKMAAQCLPVRIASGFCTESRLFRPASPSAPPTLLIPDLPPPKHTPVKPQAHCRAPASAAPLQREGPSRQRPSRTTPPPAPPQLRQHQRGEESGGRGGERGHQEVSPTSEEPQLASYLLKGLHPPSHPPAGPPHPHLPPRDPPAVPGRVPGCLPGSEATLGPRPTPSPGPQPP